MSIFQTLGQAAAQLHDGDQQLAHGLADGMRVMARRFGTALPRRLGAFRGEREAKLTGASFAQQEPDLGKEAGLIGRQVSGWAMGGSGALE